MNFYNDNDPFAAEWLQLLIDGEAIPKGKVDGRSISEVTSADVLGYRQCHWFAGVAGWPEALRIAGYGSADGIWTASMPCQPLSSAGKHHGEKDERHLWPEFYRLVSECRPAIIIGEQSASADGREWLDGISLDLEELGYAVGASDLCVAGIGSPHIRQRIYWGAVRMADTEYDAGCAEHVTESRGRCAKSGDTSECEGACRMADTDRERQSRREKQYGCEKQSEQQASRRDDTGGCSESDRLADTANSNGRRGKCGKKTGTWQDGERRVGSAGSCAVDRLGNSESDNERGSRISKSCDGRQSPTGGSDSRVDGMGYAISQGLQRHSWHVTDRDKSGRVGENATGSVAASSAWSDFRIVGCLDGKYRRLSATDEPLVAGIPRSMGSFEPRIQGMAKRARRNRIGRLKGYGNAIAPQLAAVFIQSFMDAVSH